ncbi:MAG: UDP-2,3-diacylglucosamine diphosphatase [Azonexus sp.]|nr:UDP-2,3-diacylglucosamine diphosphatase [Betaproteobacteria bacterium]MBK8917389.1 UDP-2,3-diacylglucosamine diphosphatase [Betaproteobacteria bacterium]MBP6035939.1 UDP-2,3-diacylglucosamine diphosphatase [Azonexus sp.]MBP6906461.1 UDP-2,3-diacylglucosamine diphosphatase [Azonexus sp.]
MLFFISDLHLSPRSPGATRLLLDFLAGPARQAEGLYILGDLFDAWIGDDDLSEPHNAAIVSALRGASDSGLAIALQHGNRDFLLGGAFAAAAGLSLLPDPYVLSTPEWQFVLSHGDALCSDDADYMAFRRQVRDPQWQADFLAKPLAERRAIAAHLRERSEAGKQAKSQSGSAYLMDLNPGETDDFLRLHGYATFIHGHTHHAATHDHMVDGIHIERWVLADWHEERGEVLAWNGERLTRHALP